MYDPKLRRFISADTINPDLTDPQKLNRYSYCLNNPLKYIDPSGHVPVLAVWAVTYLNAVLSSPDLQQDVNMFMLDASRGDIGGAALDVVGAALPGVSAGVVKGVGKLTENIAATFKNSQYKTKILETSQKAYRVFGGKSTLEGASDGIFLAGREYKTSTNAKKFLALPKGNTTDKISEVTIPKGTEIQYGKIERLGVQPGGGTQLYIRDKSKLIFDKPKDLK